MSDSAHHDYADTTDASSRSEGSDAEPPVSPTAEYRRRADEATRTSLLEAAVGVAGRSADASVPALLGRYYRHVATDDMAARAPEDILGATLSHRDLSRTRPEGTTNVRVFTPTMDEQKWSCGHTVVQVVTDDMPFLVDSVSAELARQDRRVHLVIHPQLVVRRDAAGRLVEIIDAEPEEFGERGFDILVESWMHIEIDRESDTEDLSALSDKVRQIVGNVRDAVEDWPRMRNAALEAAESVTTLPAGTLPVEEGEQAAAFLRWLVDDNFTFIGYREYDLSGSTGDEQLQAVPGTGLGILRYDERAGEAPSLTESVRRKAREPHALIITKANSRSTVHRNTYLDYIGVKVFDDRGEVVGERRFLGLFTSKVYAEPVSNVPVVREKVREVFALSGYAPDGHDGRDLMSLLNSYPRDELFQAEADELVVVAKDMLHAQERRQARLFLRKDVYDRFMSVLVVLPRDRYNTASRLRIEHLLREAYRPATVDYSTQVGESPLARLHFVIRMPQGVPVPDVDRGALEARMIEATRTWGDGFASALGAEFGEELAARLHKAYGGSFPEAYKEDFGPRVATIDVRTLEDLPDGRLSLNLYQALGTPPAERRLKVYSHDQLSLSRVLPKLTDLGVEVTDERPYEIVTSGGRMSYLYDIGLRAPDAALWSETTFPRCRERFSEAFAQAWDGRTESDDLGGLVLSAGLTAREVEVLRAIAAYLRQTGTSFTAGYIRECLLANPTIASSLIDLWRARFDPARFAHDEAGAAQRADAEEEVVHRITEALDAVASLDQDRILRMFLTVIRATLRTNDYQHDANGAKKPCLALKLDPHAIPTLPEPRPKFEIWVYSPRVEGVHLRFGNVARGGLRWSDRREDFRTEILGLVKAQMVKNAVIVPTGSKGGFFAKQLPDPAADRDAWFAEGVSAYKIFISGLLDLTDNRVGQEVVPPDDVVRHDPEDPYLVVAADKGTASFSDIANGVAQSYGFWLDDAFASGGSAGYDHKGMGITARGAWESVKRHFRELGVDTQNEEFTVVGVGDMSGDVFGNGMLLSEHIRLVAAFDHRHIFIDPVPDASTSYAERRRLFDLARSSWDDYDRSLMSEGGGIFPRTAKSIALTPQIVEALGIEDAPETMTPAELIHAILLAPVDLLWNGGIGTYVKASSENASDVGDRANDAIRVDGRELRVKVVGEGGNLGATQLGRIEASLAGIRVNTDAIDNSAGVDTSDHEVNLKILLTGLMKAGDLTLKQRNTLLASMTDEVAAQVLRDNYEQNTLLGNARAQEFGMLSVHRRLIHWLEERGELDRDLEFLPTDAVLDERAALGKGLTSPEFSVLVAYAKLALKADLAGSDLAREPWLQHELSAYFPTKIREKYADELASHPLAHEIIVNSVVNSLVNRGGISFAFRCMEETGATATQIAKAYVVCREVFDLAGFVAQVEALDNVVSTKVQVAMYLEFRRLLDRAIRWFLQNRAGDLDIAAEIERFAAPVARLRDAVPVMLLGAERRRLERRTAELEAEGVPTSLAMQSAATLDVFSALDIVELATDEVGGADASVEDVAALYFALSERFGFDTLLTQVSHLPREDRWDALARAAMRDDLYAVLAELTSSLLVTTPEGAPQQRIDAWGRANEAQLHRSATALQGIERLEEPGIAPLSVALRTLRGVIRGSR